MIALWFIGAFGLVSALMIAVVWIRLKRMERKHADQGRER